MRGNNKLAALAAATMLVLTAFASGAVAAASAANTAGNSDLSVGVSQADDGEVTVTVTQNNSSVDGATVNVSTVGENATYAGTGTYTTDNGTVELPAPEENVTISVTASYDNQTASTTADLVAANETRDENASDAFGLRVSSFVHDLLANQNETNQSIGQQVSEWVTSHNPGADKRPDHAGPDGNKTGRPDHAGPDGNETGRPDHAGKPDDAGNGNGNGNGHGNGQAKSKSD